MTIPHDQGDIIITPVDARDCDRLGELHYKTHKWSFKPFASQAWIKSRDCQSYVQFWCNYLANQDPSERTWKVEKGDCIVGTVSIIPLERSSKDFQPSTQHHIAPEKVACLRLMYVDPDEQGQGIGRILMHTVKLYMRSKGYRLATLITHTENKNARAFYQRMGWELDEKFSTQVPEFFPEPEAMRQRVRYRYLLHR
jgi:GNAT superfamily N-acetyltransferase